jgi:hypothetical protein
MVQSLSASEGAVVQVVGVPRSGTPRYGAYLRAGDNFVMYGIADGSYQIRFASGSDWDQEQQSFTHNASSMAFERLAACPPGYVMTLHPVGGGNTRIRRTSREVFDVDSLLVHAR